LAEELAFEIERSGRRCIGCIVSEDELKAAGVGVANVVVALKEFSSGNNRLSRWDLKGGTIAVGEKELLRALVAVFVVVPCLP